MGDLNKKIGILAILGASAMWAVEPIFAKLAYTNSDFLQTSAIRAIFVLLTATVYISIKQRTKLKQHLKITIKQTIALCYIGITATIFADLLFFFALTKISVINSIVIGHMQPIFVVLIGFFTLKEEKLTKYDYAGILTMILAGLFVSTRTPSNLYELKFGTTGDLLVLLATLGWATTTLTMKKYLKNLNAGVITFYRYLTASTIFIVYLLITSSIKISNIYQILVGITVGAGTIMYYESLKRIKAAQVTALELSTPFFAATLGFFVLNETITKMQIFGITLLLIGIYLLTQKNENRIE